MSRVRHLSWKEINLKRIDVDKRETENAVEKQAVNAEWVRVRIETCR